jgi:hypothetical protein
MEEFNIGGVRYTWDTDTRVLRNTFDPGTVATRAKGIRVVRALIEWLADVGQPYALLCSGAGASAIEVGYREEFARLFDEYPLVYLAVYEFPVDIEQIPILFGLATKIKLRAFENEADAVHWIREVGFRV